MLCRQHGTAGRRASVPLTESSAQHRGPRLRPIDRAFWAILSQAWSRWANVLTIIVKPATVIGWHRRGFARVWTMKSKHLGRPPISAELIALIERMVAENPLWSRRRIAGELAKLGHEVSKDTVAKCMPKRNGRRSSRSPAIAQRARATRSCGPKRRLSDAELAKADSAFCVCDSGHCRYSSPSAFTSAMSCGHPAARLFLISAPRSRQRDGGLTPDRREVELRLAFTRPGRAGASAEGSRGRQATPLLGRRIVEDLRPQTPAS